VSGVDSAPNGGSPLPRAPDAAHGEVVPRNLQREPRIRVDEDAKARALLLGDRSEPEILERLLDGDPIELYPSAVRWGRENGVLLDPDRMFLRLAASVAASSPAGRDVELVDWLDGRMEEAVRTILEEDLAEFRGERVASGEYHHAYLGQIFALELDAALGASVRFNALPRRSRRAFMALFIEDRKIADCIEAGLGTLESLRDDGRAGLTALTGRAPARKSKPAGQWEPS
jgi:hypothetical protein